MDENPDVNTEITLDDFNADEQQPAKAESSPAPKDEKVEKPAPAEEKAEVKEEKADDADDTAVVPDVPLKDEGDTPVETENKPKGAEVRKDQLNTEIRDLVAKRNILREEVEKANAEVYQPATETDLIDQTNPETGQAFTSVEAKVEAMRQEREMEKYNSRVADAQLTLGHESERVLNDFPMFNPDNEAYDKELAEEAAELLSANLEIDPNTNQVIGSRVSPYQLYKTLARASGISEAKGQIKAKADTETQLANVDANSSAAPPKAKVDPLLELWKSDD